MDERRLELTLVEESAVKEFYVNHYSKVAANHNSIVMHQFKTCFGLSKKLN